MLNGYDLLAGCGDGEGGGGDGEDAVRGEVRLDVDDVVALRQEVTPDELPRDEAVLVLLFFVLGLDDDAIVHGLHRYLLRAELLHVDYHLVLVLVVLDLRGTARLLEEVAPGPVIAAERRHREVAQKILPVQADAKVLVQEAARSLEVVPPVAEEGRDQCHFAATLLLTFEVTCENAWTLELEAHLRSRDFCISLRGKQGMALFS
jgi:hypothetical protein